MSEYLQVADVMCSTGSSISEGLALATGENSTTSVTVGVHDLGERAGA